MLNIINNITKSLPGDWFRQYVVFKNDLYHAKSETKRLLRILYFPGEIWRIAASRLRGKPVLPRLELVLTTRCSLRCKECSNLIPYFPEKRDYDEHQIMDDLQTLLETVGSIYRLILMGGEVFLHRSFAGILRKIKSEKRIELIHVITNGTILPGRKLLQELAHKKVVVSVSLVPAHISDTRPGTINALRQSNVNLIRFESKDWTRLGIPGIEESENDDRPENKFSRCCRRVCHTLFEGKYYICPRSYAMEKMGQIEKNEMEFVMIRGRKDIETIRAELAVLKGRRSLLACALCNGDDGRKIVPYEQMGQDL